MCGASVPLTDSIEKHLLGCLEAKGAAEKKTGAKAQLFLVQDPGQVFTLWFSAKPEATFVDLDAQLRRLWFACCDGARDNGGKEGRDEQAHASTFTLLAEKVRC